MVPVHTVMGCSADRQHKETQAEITSFSGVSNLEAGSSETAGCLHLRSQLTVALTAPTGPSCLGPGDAPSSAASHVTWNGSGHHRQAGRSFPVQAPAAIPHSTQLGSHSRCAFQARQPLQTRCCPSHCWMRGIGHDAGTRGSAASSRRCTRVQTTVLSCCWGGAPDHPASGQQAGTVWRTDTAAEWRSRLLLDASCLGALDSRCLRQERPHEIG
jgi:hypothetical protein